MSGSARFRLFWLSTILPLVVGLALSGWFARLSTGALKESLAWWTPRAIELACLVLVGGVWASRRILVELIPARVLAAALGVGLLSYGLVTVAPPQTHRIFYDEDIYQNVAQNILWRGQAQMCNEGVIANGSYDCWAAEYNKEPNAYPVLLSMVTRFTGVAETTAHALNRGLFAMTTGLILILGFILWGRLWAGFASSIVYALLPINLLWGATAAVEPGAAAFAVLAVLAAVVFSRRATLETTIFAAGAAAFATQWRPESGLVLLVIGLTVLALAPSSLRRREPYALGAIVFMLLVPHFFHVLAVQSEPWGSADGAKFAWQHIAPNASANLRYWIERREVPWLFSLFAVLGLFAVRERPKQCALVGAWFLLFFGIFLPFHAGSYRYGADIRFAVLSHAPFALFAGEGIRLFADWLVATTKRPSVRWGLLIAIAYTASHYLPLVRSTGAEGASARADHQIVEDWRAEIPENSLVLTHNPGMWQVMGQSAAQASLAQYQAAHVESLFRRFSGGIYFHYNFWCLIDDPVQNAFCAHILESYDTHVTLERSVGFERHVLYRLLPHVEKPVTSYQ